MNMMTPLTDVRTVREEIQAHLGHTVHVIFHTAVATHNPKPLMRRNTVLSRMRTRVINNEDLGGH